MSAFNTISDCRRTGCHSSGSRTSHDSFHSRQKLSVSSSACSGSTSGGYGASNGADIGLANGALVIILLHSQATSDHHGDAYVASVGGAPLFGNGEDSPGLPAEVPGVLGVTLLQVRATGGGGRSAVGTVDPLVALPGWAAALLSSAAQGHPRATSGAAGVTAAPPVGCACGAAAIADTSSRFRAHKTSCRSRCPCCFTHGRHTRVLDTASGKYIVPVVTAKCGGSIWAA